MDFQGIVQGLEKMLEDSEGENVMLGDVNLNLLDAQNKNTFEDDPLHYSKELVQRWRENWVGATNQSLIDHVPTNSKDVYSTIAEHNCLDDHIGVSSGIIKGSIKRCTKNLPALYGGKLEQPITDKNWQLKKGNSINISLSSNMTSMHEILKVKRQEEECTKIRKRDKEWITEELYYKLKERDRLFRKWKSNPKKIEYRNQYTKFRNKLNNEIRDRKETFYNNKVGRFSTDPHEIW